MSGHWGGEVPGPGPRFPSWVLARFSPMAVVELTRLGGHFHTEVERRCHDAKDKRTTT